MSDVYRAEDTVLERDVAVKLLRDISDEGAEQARFRLEARTLASLSHPALVTLLDAGFDHDQPFLVMDLVDGPSLTRHLCGPASLAFVAGLGSQVADALAYIHDAGIIRGDVKPANILLDPDGRARLGRLRYRAASRPTPPPHGRRPAHRHGGVPRTRAGPAAGGHGSFGRLRVGAGSA